MWGITRVQWKWVQNIDTYIGQSAQWIDCVEERNRRIEKKERQTVGLFGDLERNVDWREEEEKQE